MLKNIVNWSILQVFEESNKLKLIRIILNRRSLFEEMKKEFLKHYYRRDRDRERYANMKDDNDTYQED